MPRGPRRCVATDRRTAFPTVRTTSSGCSSPNCQLREAPVASPDAPASRRSCSPRPPSRRCSKTCRSAVWPSRRSAFGDSVRPPESRTSQPWRSSSRSSCWSRRTSWAAPAPSARSTCSTSTSSSVAPGCCWPRGVEKVVEVGDLGEGVGRLAVAERVLPAHPLAALPGQVRAAAPAGCRSARPSGRRGRGRRAPRPSGPASSSRCCGVSEAMSRCAAAACRASASISSSTFFGSSGNRSPCLSMNSANACVVSSPRACFASSPFRSESMSLTAWFAACRSASSAPGCIPCRASRIPRNCWSSTSPRSSSRISR